MLAILVGAALLSPLSVPVKAATGHLGANESTGDRSFVVAQDVYCATLGRPLETHIKIPEAAIDLGMAAVLIMNVAYEFSKTGSGGTDIPWKEEMLPQLTNIVKSDTSGDVHGAFGFTGAHGQFPPCTRAAPSTINPQLLARRTHEERTINLVQHLTAAGSTRLVLSDVERQAPRRDLGHR